MQQRNLDILRSFPAVDAGLADADLQRALASLRRKIVVLDDDPTGVQTVHDVSVYTGWDEAALTVGFEEPSPIFFVLTNSRSFTREDTVRIHAEIGETLCRVSKKTGKDYILISRSDSTMRGHFPFETAALREAIERRSAKRFDGEIICPFFQEGGRFTIGDIHYVREGDALVPAGDTEFARDKSFGYASSHIGAYVEEKTAGAYRKADCTYLSIPELRAGDLRPVVEKLMAVRDFRKVVVNAVDYVDIKLFVTAFAEAVQAGKEFLFRSAAAIPKVLGNVSDQPLLRREQLIDAGNTHGGIVLIGSHVNKTTQQFEALRDCRFPAVFIEFDQHQVLAAQGLEPEVRRVVALAGEAVSRGDNAVVYTRRERFDLDTDDKEAQLKVSTQISDAVTSIIGRLPVRPNFIIAKGGITSSDVGTKALGVKKATVMGQVEPGVPVWMTGEESKFPRMPYVIFPGNVGERDTLRKIVERLSDGDPDK